MKISEENMVDELRNRNPAALEYIINQYGREVYALIYNILRETGTREDVEECSSEVFVSVWNRWDRYVKERSSFRTWLFVVAKYCALDYKRSIAKGRDLVSTEEIELVSPELVESTVMGKDTENRIIQAINTLKKTDKEIFYRRYFFHESIDAIARHFNLTREAVDNRLCRGRKKLKKRIFSNGKGEVIE